MMTLCFQVFDEMRFLFNKFDVFCSQKNNLFVTGSCVFEIIKKCKAENVRKKNNRKFGQFFEENWN